jgi:hypothetical protein
MEKAAKGEEGLFEREVYANLLGIGSHFSPFPFFLLTRK